MGRERRWRMPDAILSTGSDLEALRHVRKRTRPYVSRVGVFLEAPIGTFVVNVRAGDVTPIPYQRTETRKCAAVPLL
jgi:hypothetical protein